MLRHIQWAKKDYRQTSKQNQENKMNKIYKQTENTNRQQMIFLRKNQTNSGSEKH